MPEEERLPAYRVPQDGKCNPGSLNECNSFVSLSREVVRCRCIQETFEARQTTVSR
jgi:hypothetical protein